MKSAPAHSAALGARAADADASVILLKMVICHTLAALECHFI